MKRIVYISDCDHIDINEEIKVFNENDIEYKWLNCHSEEELMHDLSNAESAICQYARFTESVFSKLPKLKMLVRYGVGVDNIDLDAARRHGVYVSNVPDYGIEEVASHALALMMALSRKIIPMDRSVHEGIWQYERSIPIKRISECTVGVVGIGRIGSAFARQVSQLKPRIVAYDPFITQPADSSIEMVSLDELLERSDFVSLHCPLENARNLIGVRELKIMKPSAFLINVSRGGIIDEDALDEALTNGYIAGAAVDVLEQEPIRPNHPLLRHENCICTPHMAWYSVQAARDLKKKAAQEAVRYFTGEDYKYCICKPE